MESMEIVLVTGGNGFIGSHLIKHLIKKSFKIYSLDISENNQSYYFGERLDKYSEFIKADILDYEKLEKTINKIKPGLIFHLAAKTLVEDSFDNPLSTFKTNIMGTVNILEIARKNPSLKSLIIASSDKAYGKLKSGKYYESHSLKGNHPYEVSKSSADLIAQSYYKTYKLPVVITRAANVYGEGDLNFSRIIPGIMKALINDETLEIRSNGNFVRDYIYVEDIVNGYLAILNNFSKIQGESFNISSGESLSVLQLISVIEKALGKKIKYKILNIVKNEIPYQSLNFSKIKNRLNWQPEYNIEKVAERIYTWYRKFYEK